MTKKTLNKLLPSLSSYFSINNRRISYMELVKLKLFDNSVSTEEKRFFYLVALVWAQYPLLHFIEALFNIVFGVFITPILMDLLWIVAIVFGLSEINKKIRGSSALIIILLLSVLYILNYVFYPQNEKALDYNAQLFFMSALPCFLLGSIMQIKKGVNFLFYVSMLCIIAQYLFSFVYGNNRALADEGEGGDQLTAAYLILPHVLLTIAFFIKRPNWLAGIGSILGFLLLLSFGSRGPILCVFMFVLMALLYKQRMHSFKIKNLILFFILLGGCVVLVNHFWQNIIEVILSSQNMSDRLVIKMVENNFFESEDRDDIRTMLLSELSKNPITGYGVAGDRYFIGVLEGGYAHNIIVEILFSFGYVFGGGLLIIIAFLIFRGLKYYSDDEKFFVLVLISCGLIGLFFSGTYLTSKWFFFLLGVCSVAKNNYIKERVLKIQSRYHVKINSLYRRF